MPQNPKPADREQADAGFFPVPLALIQVGTMAPVDLYIKSAAAQPFVLYRAAHTVFREEVRERLVGNGVDTLWLSRKDERAFDEYVEENIGAIVRSDLMPPREASKVVYNCSARVMQDVFSDPRSGRNMQRAQNMIEAAVLTIMKNPNSLWHMTELASHDYYTYTHCVNVSMFLVAASAELLDIRDEQRLRRIGMGGIFHDIGKSHIPEKILLKPGKLTPEEFATIKEHPQLGLDVVGGHTRLPRVSAEIIRHHHERFDGSGYPDGLKGDQISSVARLSTVIDVYDALTTKRCYAPARKPFDAVELMVTRMAGHFDGDLLRGFVRFLGPDAGAAPPEAAPA